MGYNLGQCTDENYENATHAQRDAMEREREGNSSPAFVSSPTPAAPAAATPAAVSYSDFVAALAKPGADIIDTLSPSKAHLWHMVTGVSGEAGELVDAVKKHVLYGKSLDRENVIEELGDLRFYEQGIMTELAITAEEVEAHNRAKLGKRYASLTYSDTAAQERADKAEVA